MQNSAVSFSACFNYDKKKLNSLLEDLNKSFSVKYNSGLQLITIRHYNDHLIDEIERDNKIFLVQKSRVTVQLLVLPID